MSLRRPSSCEECFFFYRRKDDDVGFTDYVCRRHPPKGGWPIVRKDDFCGEFWDKKVPYVLLEDYYK